MEIFKEQVKQWVHIDDKIRENNENNRKLKEQKNNLYDEIHEYATNNKLLHSTFSVQDNNLKFVNTKQIQPLTLQFIKDCLLDCIASEEDVNTIMKHIKESRTYKVNTGFKRYDK